MQARYRGTCAACGGRFPRGAEITYSRATKTARHIACDPDGASGDGLVYVEGDNRPFARTRYGLRAGYEHTGHRCIDAPCCGCCD